MRIVALQVAAARPCCVGHVEHERVEALLLQSKGNVNAIAIYDLDFLRIQNVR